MINAELIERLLATATGLRKSVEHASFGGSETYVRVIAPELLLADLSEAAIALQAAQKEIERLTADCARLKEYATAKANQCGAAERERDELRRALEPFCFGDQDLVDILWGDFPDDKTVTIRVPLGYLRRARAALNQEVKG